ncbi:MAG TPA: hypothetical protein PLV92_19295, partial [Pirellulaceae bacterium]|nr:hypothetical protein [Pirellulaceae bacterium]
MNFALSSVVVGCRRVFVRSDRTYFKQKSLRRRVSFAAAALTLALCCATTASVGAADEAELARGFTTDVKPLVAK